MSFKKVALLLVFGILIVNVTLSQTGSGTKPDKKNESLLKKREDTKEGPARVDALFELSTEYRRLDPEKALDYANRGLELSKKIGYRKGIADGFFSIAFAYYYKYDYPRALEYLFKSAKIKEELEDKIGLAVTYNIVGVIYYNQSNNPGALEYYFKSLTIAEELENKNRIASSSNNIGLIYARKNDYAGALKYYFKSLKIWEEMGDNTSISGIYNNIGLVYYHQKDYTKALDYYSKSLKIKEESGNIYDIASTYNNIGHTYSEQKDFDRALESYLESNRIAKKTGEKLRLASSYNGIGSCYAGKGQHRKAIKPLLSALKLARELDALEEIALISETLSEVYAELNQFDQAYRYQVLFKEKNDSLKSEENVKKMTQLEMQYEFEKKQKLRKLEQEKNDMEKEAELNRQKLMKYMFSGIAVLLAFVFYTRYRLKVKVNRKLRKEIREREHVEAELLKSMKLETVGILSAGIAHDFNNLLAVILGNLAMAKESLDDRRLKPDRYIGIAEKASDQAAELVGKFLTLSEGGWVSRSKVRLADILVETKMAAPQIKDIPFTISLAGDLNPLYGDDRQLRQVMVNLLLNANEATAERNGDKKIGISAQNIFLPGYNEWSLKEGEYLNVTVEDNGKGIAPDVLGKIFDPYFSTKVRGNQKGMGMGLALCFAIVQKHEGHIAVTSSLGEGTSVDLYLPAYKLP